MNNRPTKLLIWGGGFNFNRMLPYLHERENNGEIRIIGVVDKYGPEDGTIGGYPYVAPSDVPAQDFDYLRIMSAKYRAEIVREYLAMPGSDAGRIIGNVYPEISIEQHFEIAEARPTIFSTSCWAGFIYHNLGIECTSPFKNLWLFDTDFMRFLQDPRGYMAEDPVPVRMQKRLSQYDEDIFPIIRLGDIDLYCNHSNSMEEAISDWIRRREKINWNNVLVQMNTTNPKIEKEFNRLDIPYRRLCFVPYPTNEPYSFYLAPKKHPFDLSAWIDQVNATAFPYKNPFDMYSLFFGEPKVNPCYDPAR